MVRHEEEVETMSSCGCPTGRPCTCGMGRRMAASATSFICGICVNCRLNAREETRPSRRQFSAPRRCLKSEELLAELAFDRVLLPGNCEFRMRKPDWNVDEKTPMYNKLHQMRLAMIHSRVVSLATIDTQKKMRLKYSSDLRKTQDAIAKFESLRKEAAKTTRKMATEHLCVDSDAFDSFSNQLIAAETLLPDLKLRLQKTNTIISTEQRTMKAIREYIRDFAVRKIQSSMRAYLRFRRWKGVLCGFHDDVYLSAALEIQATWRMFTAKKEKLLLAQLRDDEVTSNAVNVMRRFSITVIEANRRKNMVLTKEGDNTTLEQVQKSLDALFALFGRGVLYNALENWRVCTNRAKHRELQKTLASAVLIQRVYRGFRDRIYLKRVKIRRSLTDRVGVLVDKFIVSGDFWGFLLEIDADYRRFTHRIEEEEADATTFMATVLRQRKLDDAKMMQDWFTASALQNPLVNRTNRVMTPYNSEEGNPVGSSLSQAILKSSLAEDLVALSPNKRKDEVFPPDFPPKVIRQAMAKGFSLDEVVAVMRGLQAQRKDIEDVDLVMATLQKRSPLMTNPWTSERALRESRSPGKSFIRPIPAAKLDRKPLSKKTAGKKPADSFVSANLLGSIPGGMNAPIARLLLVAALRCYDPGSRGEKGRFVPCDDHKSELFQLYLSTESPLVKIRSEQHAMEAVKPFLRTLLENRCYTAYDILYNVRGVGELVSWNIPSPLAKSIYSVIQVIHTQSTYISRRNIIKEVRVSADFERFLNFREQIRSSPRGSKTAGQPLSTLTARQTRD